MSNVRNQNDRIVDNNVRHYRRLVGRRDVKNIRHYTTPTMKHPSVSERANVSVDNHVWAYGDRFYNLAFKYYGDQRFWWVIAWWNGYPTEGSIKSGDLISIPLNLNKALDALGV